MGGNYISTGFKSKNWLVLNLPDTPTNVISRSWAGTFGTAEIKTQQKVRRFLPIWMLYTISALINDNASFRVMDAQAEGLDNNQTYEAIKKMNPDAIITLICLPSYHNDCALIKKIKQSFPETIIVILGGLVYIDPQKMLEQSDADILLHARFPFYNSVKAFLSKGFDADGIIYKKRNSIEINPAIADSNDLDYINIQAYDYLPLNKYILSATDREGNTISWLPILTGVGCPYSCTYCAYPIAYGKKIHYKTIDKIIDEIQHIVKTYHISGYCLRDVVFTKDRDRVISFCKKLEEKNLKIKFFFETRIGLLDKKLIDILKKAGCFQMNIGVESGSPDILKKVGKPGININLLKETFHLLDQAGINTMAHIIIGLPGENKHTIKQTYNLLKKIHATEVNVNFITPYPGTKFYDYATKNDLILDYNWDNYTSHNLVMKSEYLSGEKLKKQGMRLERKLFFYKLLHNKQFRIQWIKNRRNHD